MFIYQRVYQFPMAPMRAIETVNIDNVAHMEPEKITRGPSMSEPQRKHGFSSNRET